MTNEEEKEKLSRPKSTFQQIKLCFLNATSLFSNKLRRKFKSIACLLDNYDRLSPRARMASILFCILWKCFTTSLTIYLVYYGGTKLIKKNNANSFNNQADVVNTMHSAFGSSSDSSSVLLPSSSAAAAASVHLSNNQFKILHIVTSLAEYNNGSRNTEKGQDRLQEVIIPTIKAAVNSILSQPNWSVDVYLVLGFNLAPKRRLLIEKALPPGVHLEVWNDATPYSYDEKRMQGKVLPCTRALARQHRYVIQDKLEYYDFFTAFEDDMRITATHIKAFVDLSNRIEVAKKRASSPMMVRSADTSIMGQMTKKQLERVIPGFFRVEVLIKGAKSQDKMEGIPVDHFYDEDSKVHKVNPEYCCAVPSKEQTKKLLPTKPKSHELMTWETSIRGFFVRQFPDPIGWMGMLPGSKKLSKEQIIGSYWAGDDPTTNMGVRSGAGDGRLFGQQGGFMASREQIKEFHRLCPAGFLPPYDLPLFRDDGLFMNNVEYWSGGYQLFGGGKGGCNFQRILPLDPEEFSKFLLYHTANNKQRQITRTRLLLVENLLGQLNTVKKRAMAKIKKI